MSVLGILAFVSGCSNSVVWRRGDLYVGAFRTHTEEYAQGARYEALRGYGVAAGVHGFRAGYLKREQLVVPDLKASQTINCPLGLVSISADLDALNANFPVPLVTQ